MGDGDGMTGGGDDGGRDEGAADERGRATVSLTPGTATLTSACLPDMDAERRHLSDVIPVLPIGIVFPAGTVPPAGTVLPTDPVPPTGTVIPADTAFPAGTVVSPGTVVATGTVAPLLRGGDGPGTAARCDVLGWARSGLAHLTGLADGPPLAPTAPVLARAAIVADTIARLAGAHGRLVRLDVAEELAGRARTRGWHRQGTTSVNGSCRLLKAADGWLAVNLARPDDVDSVPAILGELPDGDVWSALAAHASVRPAGEVAAAAQLVGVPAAVVGGSAPAPVRMLRAGRPGSAALPLVVDLSAMWAGPLCARVLHQAGWRVVKVEDTRRPDGTRFGPPDFYAALHAGIPEVRLDFAAPAGRAELARLAAQADVLIESSRPRALRRLGLVAEEWLAQRPGRIWVSVTGYGREDPAQRVAFGDDAAAAGGLVAWTPGGTPVFCGDAIADPLTGMMAALAGLAAHADGGGWLVDVAMAGVCADLARTAGITLASTAQADTLQTGPGQVGTAQEGTAQAGTVQGNTARARTAPVEHAVTGGDGGWTMRHGAAVAAVRAW